MSYELQDYTDVTFEQFYARIDAVDACDETINTIESSGTTITST